MVYESQIDVYISCITRLLLRIDFQNINIFDDVIPDENDVIEKISLHSAQDFGLFFHMNQLVFDMHVAMTHTRF